MPIYHFLQQNTSATYNQLNMVQDAALKVDILKYSISLVKKMPANVNLDQAISILSHSRELIETKYESYV